MATKQFHADVARPDSVPYGTVCSLNGLIASTLFQVLGNPGLEPGTDTSKVATSAAITVLLNGQPIALGIEDDFWTLSGEAIPPSSTATFILTINALGGAAAYQSAVVPAGQTPTFPSLGFTSPAAAVIALAAQGEAIVGVVEVTTNGATTFTPGTTDLDASGVTDVYVAGSTAAGEPFFLADASGRIFGVDC